MSRLVRGMKIQKPKGSRPGSLPEALSQFILASPAGIMLADRLGTITLINDAAARIFDYCRTDLEGQPLSMILPAREAAKAASAHLKEVFDYSFTPSMTHGHHLLAKRRDGTSTILEICETLQVIDAVEYMNITVIDKSSFYSIHDAFKQSEAYKDLVIDEVPVLISYIDHEFRYRYVNRQYEKWLNYRKEACLGRHVWEIVGDASFATARPKMEKALRGEKTRFQNRLFYPSLGLRDVETAYLPHRDDHNKVLGFFVVVNDITMTKRTELKVLAAKDRSFKTLLDSMPYFAWVADQHGNFTFVNKAWVEELGITTEQCYDTGWLAAIELKDQERVLREWKEALAGSTPFDGTARFCTKEGLRHYHYLAMQIFGFPEQPVSWLCILTDIDDSLKLQGRLQEEKETAEKANKAKSTFLTHMSHEIRTPLAVIMNYVELLEENDLELNERQRFLMTVRRNGEHLLELINNILDLSKIESEKTDLRSKAFSLVHEMESLRESFKAEALQKGLKFSVCYETPLPMEVKSDPQLLRQILVNLVSNALKFTFDGFVCIAVAYEDAPNSASDPSLLFSVRDSGVGIDPLFQDKIFQPFVQADNSHSRQFQGSGLGLTLSKNISKILRGDLYLKASKPSEGSEFVLKIPIEQPEVSRFIDHGLLEESPREHSGARALAGARILVVEDNRDMQAVITRVFTAAGAQVTMATNGQEGLATAQQLLPDVTFMDLQMPVMDGYQALAALRRSKYTKPIIALTSHAFKEELVKCMEEGFDDYLRKPASKQQLIAMASKWFNASQHPIVHHSSPADTDTPSYQ